MTEELRLDEVLGKRRAVDDLEGPFGPRRVLVEGTRNELLAGARLAVHERRRIGARDLEETREELAHDVGAAEKWAEVILGPQVDGRRLLFVVDPDLDSSQPEHGAAGDARALDAHVLDEGPVGGRAVQHPQAVITDRQLAVQAGHTRGNDDDVRRVGRPDAMARIDAHSV